MSVREALRRAPEARVFGVMLLGLFALTCAVVVHGLGLPYDTPLSVLGTFLYLWVFWILPAALPAAAAGAWLAVRVMRRESPGRSLWFWAWRAVAVGAALGAAGAVLWWFAMFLTVPDHLRRVIGPVTAIGAGAGASVGLLVALYCWRSYRTPTGP